MIISVLFSHQNTKHNMFSCQKALLFDGFKKKTVIEYSYVSIILRYKTRFSLSLGTRAPLSSNDERPNGPAVIPENIVTIKCCRNSYNKLTR